MAGKRGEIVKTLFLDRKFYEKVPADSGVMTERQRRTGTRVLSTMSGKCG